ELRPPAQPDPDAVVTRPPGAPGSYGGGQLRPTATPGVLRGRGPPVPPQAAAGRGRRRRGLPGIRPPVAAGQPPRGRSATRPVPGLRQGDTDPPRRRLPQAATEMARAAAGRLPRGGRRPGTGGERGRVRGVLARR